MGDDGGKEEAGRHARALLRQARQPQESIWEADGSVEDGENERRRCTIRLGAIRTAETRADVLRLTVEEPATTAAGAAIGSPSQEEVAEEDTGERIASVSGPESLGGQEQGRRRRRRRRLEINVSRGLRASELESAIRGASAVLQDSRSEDVRPVGAAAARRGRLRAGWDESFHQGPTPLGRAWIRGGCRFVQIRCAKQWHSNTCGYHALLNALRGLEMDADRLREAAGVTDSTSQGTSQASASDEEDAAIADEEGVVQPDQIRAWEFITDCYLRLLDGGRWSRDSLRSGILDASHVQELISQDSRLVGRVSVVDTFSAEKAVRAVEALESASRRGERHAFVLGATHHWLTFVYIPSGVAAARGSESDLPLCLVFDSHNKLWQPVLNLERGGGDDERYRDEVSAFVERNLDEWRTHSRERKIIADPNLAHHPPEVLDRQFDEGVPEYWKGHVKDACWWRHKPVSVLRRIVQREAAVARGLADLVAGASLCEVQQPVADEDDLWFGSRRCRLVTAPGHFEADRGWTVDRSAEALRLTLSRSEPLRPSGRDESELPIVLPCVPSLELRRSSVVPPVSSEFAPAPQVLKMPLRKAALSPTATEGEIGCDEGGEFRDTGLHAVASGVRSALVKVHSKPGAEDHTWYRLKGCGNGDGPFVLRQGGSGTWQEIRGSAFYHTAARDQHMTAQLADELTRLQKDRVVCANKCVGMYCYSGELCPFGDEALFRPCCVVQETLGDRRLGTHVLSGVDLLLPHLIEVDDYDALLRCFPARRPDPSEVSTAELMTDAMLAFELAPPGSHGLTWDVPRDGSLFGDANALTTSRRPFSERAPSPSTAIAQWELDGPKPFDYRWTRMWTKSSAALEECIHELKRSGRDKVSLLGYLFARLGQDAGKVLKFMHTRGISWGTYADKMCAEGQRHVNAHSNNLVMLSPTAAEANHTHSLLAFTDLDMAFSEHDYVDVLTGQIGHTEFDELFQRERINLAEVLAQADSTSGLPAVAIGVVEKYSKPVATMRNLLFDTLLKGYVNAYDNGADDLSFDPLLHKGAYAIIQLAIMVMADCVA